MPAPRWEFSIDVGGTFTDCLARAPDGSHHRLKILSSGAVKGRVGDGADRFSVVDSARRNDPADFWAGWQFILLDDEGAEIDRAPVTHFDPAAARFRLSGLKHSPSAEAPYELRCDEEAPVIAIRYLLRVPLSRRIPPVVLRLGTTRGTNALLTRSGAATALVTTQGFADVLDIGYQARPRLFDLTIRKPPPLTSAVVEAPARFTYDGHTLVEPNEVEIRQQLQSLYDSGIRSLALCLLHADRHPAHEQLIARMARDLGFREISASHQVAPLPKLVARADTTVVDAYLNPVLREYVAKLVAALPDSSLRLLTSAGGLVAAASFSGKDSVLSGPAGGVVGFSKVAQAAGFDRAIGFDMGGTSTDVSRFDGRFELEYETQKAGIRIVAPTMAIETVAAGGGSICRFDGVKLVVGPESAGADPGPACYGRGGPLTVTDLNYFLGRLVAHRFPFPLDQAATQRRLYELASEVTAATGLRYTLHELASSLLQIANASMAAAIRRVTIAKGADPADYVLVPFGAAGPQHTCAIARELGIRHILNHPDAGVLSALGIGLADVVRHRSQGVEQPLDPAVLDDVRDRLGRLEQEAAEELRAEGVKDERILARRSLDIRYRGVDSYLTIDWPDDDDFASAFALAHRARYGYVQPDRPLEIVAVRVEVAGQVADELPRSKPRAARQPRSNQSTIAYFDGAPCDVPVFERTELLPGHRIDGPAIVTEQLSTTVIDPGWNAEVLTGGELLLRDALGRRDSENRLAASTERNDPALLEIFNHLLVSVAQQMGVTLQNTASSVNVKERLDFSCAIFTADGRLVANAPHVPVHLGAMEETVRHTIAANPDLRPGDVIATNDPYAGGSHLPDVTVITPIFSIPRSGKERELLFFTASRAHHAEIGGIVPGSMPPFSTNLAEEGVLIRNLKIVDQGVSRFDKLSKVLTTARYPTRDVAANLADVAAQVAANRQGENDLLALVERFTWPVVRQYMDRVQEAAEKKVRLALAKLPIGTHSFTDYLETCDGAPSGPPQSIPIQVRFTIHPPGSPRAASIDFAGTAPPLAGNLNANRAIVTAAVIYVLRLLVDEDIPLNHGVLQAIEIALPTCLLNPEAGSSPETTPAVAGGNVETSQRVVDVLLGALGIAAASQGTMNNVIFGNDSFGYYETICGGSGATAHGPGADAVQVHMTNTRLTDPEILERRYPVRLREFSIRRGSGGAGQFRGGDGVVRRIEFLEPLTLSLLTQRRGPHPPYGAAGGLPGAVGRNLLQPCNGLSRPLSHSEQISVAAGDILTIETPGGGGFGAIR